MSERLDRLERFEQCMRESGDKAYNFAFRLSGNAQDARDLVQEALMRALTHFDRYDPARSFDTWLCHILHNLFLDTVKRADHRNVSLDQAASGNERSWEEFLPGTDEPPLEHLSRDDRERLVQKSLDGLPPLYRSAVVMCDIEGMSYEEIAQVMECPVGTVRSRIHEGRRRVREIYLKLEEKGRVS